MNEELLALQLKVSTIIYNPFINLKDQANALKKILAKREGYAAQITKLDEALSTLDQLEGQSHGNVDRIKGFNKAKNNILKLIKEVTDTESK